MPRPGTSSIARPPLPPVPRIVETATVNPRDPSPGSLAPSTVPIPAHSSTPQPHSIPIRADIYGGKEHGTVSHPILSEVTATARTLFLVRRMHPGPLPEAENIGSFMREIR